MNGMWLGITLGSISKLQVNLCHSESAAKNLEKNNKKKTVNTGVEPALRTWQRLPREARLSYLGHLTNLRAHYTN